MNIPFHRPSLDDDDIHAVTETLKSGWITTGPTAIKFQNAFAEYTGAKHAIALNSCTAAMHLALQALGIGRGDLVITTPYTFVATAEAIQYVGAIPVFVDIQETDFNLSPQKVEDRINNWNYERDNECRPHHHAILPVHIAGQPCDMVNLKRIADEHNLALVEDAAHCLEGEIRTTECAIWNSEFDTRNSKLAARDFHDHSWLKVGNISDATCFSFYATKNITTGEGGMITTNDDDLAAQMRILSLHGMSKDAWKRYANEGSWYYEIVAQGYKYNMTDIAAALGLSQLRKAKRMHATRKMYADFLIRELGQLDEIILPHESPNVNHAWHLFIIRLRLDLLNISRNEFILELQKQGVQTSVHFIPLHLQPFFQKKYNYHRGDFPVAEKVYESAVSLPFYPDMSEEEISYVAKCVKETIKNNIREQVIHLNAIDLNAIEERPQ